MIKKKTLIYLGGVIFLGGLAGLVLGRLAIYKGKVYPKIAVAGVEIGKLTPMEAKNKLVQELEKKEVIELIADEGEKEEFLIDKIGLKYDWFSSVKKAYFIGRSGKFWEDLKIIAWPFASQKNLAVFYDFSQKDFNEELARIEEWAVIPAVEPAIKIIKAEGEKKIEVTAGQPGRDLDKRLFLQILEERIGNLDFSLIKMPFLTTSPALTNKEVLDARERGESFLGKELEMTFEDKQWKWGEEELLNLIAFSGDFKELEIVAFVEGTSESIDRPPEDALFQFGNDRVTEFKPAKEGWVLDQPRTAAFILEKLKKLEETDDCCEKIVMPVEKSEPKITIEDINNLGIKELIGRGESWFAGSIGSRIHNLTLAAERLNGELLAPGEVFSFNERAGEVSGTTGYQNAYIIKEGRTILGTGGGLCQVSTTFFRAALETGVEIIERKAHAYRVGYYEQNTEPGIDATVYDPSPDFKFKNDTLAYILIQTKVFPEENKLRVDFYGASDGRKVARSKVRIWDQRAPPPALYQNDPTLAAGVVKQIDWPAWGAKTSFDWEVTREGIVLHKKTFYSSYQPWQAIYLKGTK